ncbi:MAG: helicase-related protein [Patescibacteria group bacterium]
MQTPQQTTEASSQNGTLTIERLDDVVADSDGCQYASMNFYRNQVGLNTLKLMLLLKKIPQSDRRNGRTKDGDALSLYPIRDVDRLFLEHGILRRGQDIVLENPLEAIIFKKVQYASRDFFKQTFHLSDEIFDTHVASPEIEHRKAVNTEGDVVIIYPVMKVVKVLTEIGFFRDVEKEAPEPKTPEEKIPDLEAYLKELADGTAIDQETFDKLLAAFGPSRVVDIIFRLRPAFKDIEVGEVEKIIPRYLGDCLVQRRGFRPDVVVEAGKHLSDPDNQKCLYETLRYRCFELFLERRRYDKQSDEALLVKSAVDDLACALSEEGALENESVKEIWNAVEEYYLALANHFEKPDRLVDHISPDRAFPDMSQRINIKDIMENKRMLIADEMSGGKSASAIIAKEYLGAKLAVICAPSNVIATWREYLLSDEKRLDGSLKGYFKEGQKPRVFVVESSLQLALIDSNAYDYILISHGRMARPEYNEFLVKLPYDMVILDESHKLKKISKGVQSRAALRLMNKLQGENEYVVLLSGTPVPNKVRDVAFLLKALYPEKFEQENNQQLIQRIIKGGVIELRNLLIPRMQMKKLSEIVDIAPVIEHPPIRVQISPQERAIYNQVFLDDDQFTSTEKIIAMRQFLMNPEIFEPTPGFPASMVEALGMELRTALESHDKILVFTNSYVDGILRKGKYQTTIIERLGLPADVVIEVIDASTSQKDREDIQRRFNSHPDKIIIFASGQTTDVGVDFSGAEVVVTYNHPWTKYEYLQQVGRANRCTRKHTLHVKMLRCPGTIEEGVYAHVRMKYEAIERLLNGVPLTEEQRRLLHMDAKNDEEDDELSEELSTFHLAQCGELMSILKQMYHIGEKGFKNMLKTRGEAYARGYAGLSNRCYQANMNRMVGTIIENSIGEREQNVADLAILDLASGPEMLRRVLPEAQQEAVTSLDLNEKHFENAKGKTVVGSFLDTGLETQSFDYVACSLAFHYTPECRAFQTETIELLKEINRLVKIGGRTVITLNYNYELKDPIRFREIVSAMFGFDVIESMTGCAENDGVFGAHVITLEKREDVSYAPIDAFVGLLKRKEFAGLQIKKNDHSLVDSRWIMDEVVINGRSYPIALNALDRQTREKEQSIIDEAVELFDTYSALYKIPEDVLTAKGFCRVKVKNRYVLLKQISNGDDPKFILVKPEFIRRKRR